MAYKCIKIRGEYYLAVKEFQCATRADVAGLPTTQTSSEKCAPGSTAFVEADSSVWILSVDGATWAEV